MLRALAVLPLLLGTPSPSPQPTVLDSAIQESIVDLPTDGTILDLTLTVEDLEVETRQGEQTSVTISSDVLFAFDKADLTETARRRIAALADRLKNSRGVITVEGHTDSLGSPSYNLRLSRKRADAVKRELARLVPEARIKAVGYGESRPIAPNTKDGKDYPEGRAKNRRVTIKFNGG